VAVQHTTASHQGRDPDIKGQLMRMDKEDSIGEVQEHYSDQETLDAFWVTG
jgi:hypothetical protein